MQTLKVVTERQGSQPVAKGVLFATNRVGPTFSGAFAGAIHPVELLETGC